MVLLAALAIIIYLLPALVAGCRGHQNRIAIGALNILLGWTFVGWVIALVWALTALDARARPGARIGPVPEPPLPFV